nr:hypothetical protein BaRGS_009566 [Batillaria attramentaria]
MVPTTVGFLPKAGITLSNFTFNDLGTYRVTVNFKRSGSFFSQSRSAVLALPDAPIISGDRLVAHVQAEPVTDVITGDRHIGLTCGTFLELGSRPVSVDWRTPSGETVPSTSFSHGEFHLTLPNPVVGGSYVCRLKDPSFAARCVKNMSALRRGAHVLVDEVQTRLLLLEDGVQGLQDKDQAVDDELERLEEKDANLTSRDDQLQKELLLLEDGVQGLQDKDQAVDDELERLEEKDANLTSRDDQLQKELLLLEDGVQGLQDKDQAVDDELERLEEKDTNLTSRDDQLQKELLLLEDGVQGLQDKDQAVDDELERLEEKDANLTSRDDQLQKELLQLGEADDKIQSEVDDLRADVNSNVYDLQHKVSLREKADDTLASDLTDLQGNVSALEKRNTLEDKLASDVATLQEEQIVLAGLLAGSGSKLLATNWWQKKFPGQLLRTSDAAEAIVSHVHDLDTTAPDALKVITGDFNHCDVTKVLPGVHNMVRLEPRYTPRVQREPPVRSGEERRRVTETLLPTLPAETVINIEWHKVTDAPIISGDRLVAHVQAEPVTDVITGERHIDLTCGTFLELGSRPVSVDWRTPSGETVPSTSFSHGEFHLTLPNPVDKDQAVEDELEQLEEKDANLTSRDDQLQEELLQLGEADDKIQSEVDDLRADVSSDVNDLQHKVSLREEADDTLASDLTDLQGKVSALEKRNTLEDKLASDVATLQEEQVQIKKKTSELEDLLKEVETKWTSAFEGLEENISKPVRKSA